MNNKTIKSISILTSFLFALLLFSGAFCGTAMAAVDENGFVYTGTTLTSYLGDATEITIPNNIVTINTSVFEQSIISSVTIPSSVKTIGKTAFIYSGYLTSVNFENPTIQTIGEAAFSRCNNLETIVLPDTITSLGDGVFLNCSKLKNVHLPNNLTVIPTSTFKSCKKLETVNIPENTITIGNGAFYYCEMISEIEIPETVSSIESTAFRYCSKIKTIDLSKNTDLTTITSFSFANMTGLETVVLPDSVETIERYAFYKDNLLSEITIGKNVTSIGEGAFDNTAEGFTIKCYDNTEALSYAIDNNINYELISEADTDSEVEDGWANDSYYVDGVMLTGIQSIDGYYYDFGEDGICEGRTKYSGFVEIDGKYYYSKLGTLATGWIDIDGDWYYFRTTTKFAATGFYNVGGVVFEFDSTGKLLHGVWVEVDGGRRYYYGPSYYKSNSSPNSIWATIDGEQYAFDSKGIAYTGVNRISESNSKTVDVYSFDENGVCLGKVNTDDFTGVVETKNSGIFYFENGQTVYAGLIEFEGYYYYVKHYGVVATGSYYVTKNNDLIPVGTYDFGDDGKLEIPNESENNGIVNGIYYENGEKVYAGLIEIDGYYYYIKHYGVVATGSYYVTKNNNLLPVGTYDFGPDGRLEIAPQTTKNGIVDGIYYENDVKTYAGLIEIDGDYYYIKHYGVVATGSYYVTKTNGLLPAGTYNFGTDGKMIVAD